MSNIKNILLASHGTVGARAAEQKVFEICVGNIHITHLLVVPELWKNMVGNDWLSNSSTHKQFCDYLEAELGREIDQHIERVHGQLEHLGVSSTHTVVLGDPKKCLIGACKQSTFDLVVMGSPRPKELLGLHSRMVTNLVTNQLAIPFLVVPHPNA
jgi:nucleotide-binding universal stress UspA family protein